MESLYKKKIVPKIPRPYAGIRVFKAFAADLSARVPTVRYPGAGGLRLSFCLHQVCPSIVTVWKDILVDGIATSYSNNRFTEKIPKNY